MVPGSASVLSISTAFWNMSVTAAGTEGILGRTRRDQGRRSLSNTSRVLRNSYVRRHQPHADVTAIISGKLGPALDEVARHRSG